VASLEVQLEGVDTFKPQLHESAAVELDRPLIVDAIESA
jgi:hypothetical protein